MSVYKKLQEARVKLQSINLKKSGKNKFAGYEYFELGDFLPAIQKICNEIGLCGVVSFNKEEATLSIYDVDGGGPIVFSSPMSSAQLKGCHDVQNLGAVQTYLRRYLWTNAFEIIEHDALDAITGKKDKVNYISVAQQDELKELISRAEVDVSKFLSYFKAASVEKLLASNYEPAKIALKKKLAEDG